MQLEIFLKGCKIFFLFEETNASVLIESVFCSTWFNHFSA